MNLFCPFLSLLVLIFQFSLLFFLSYLLLSIFHNFSFSFIKYTNIYYTAYVIFHFLNVSLLFEKKGIENRNSYDREIRSPQIFSIFFFSLFVLSCSSFLFPFTKILLFSIFSIIFLISVVPCLTNLIYRR